MRWLPTLPLQVWLGVSYLIVLVLPLVALVASGALGRDLVQQTRWDLEHQGALLAMLVEREVADGASFEQREVVLSAHLARAKQTTLAGFRLVDARGIVVASSGDGLGLDLSADAEVRAALDGGAEVVLRPRSPAEGIALGGKSRRATVRVFVAVPVTRAGRVIGALVLSRTPREELQALYQMAPAGLLAGAGFALVVTLLFALGASRILTRSLLGVAEGSGRIAAGHFDGVERLARPKESRLREVAAAARSVEAMALRLRERLAYIGEFASNVAHEFKTPLATLKGTLELLEDDPAMEPSQRERFLANAAAEVERLERLVNGLLALARADQARGGEVVDLDALLDELASRYGAPKQGSAGAVRGDRAQLDAAIANLLENARVHGGSARLRAFTEADRCGVDVIDDGPGISEANLPRVFDRFFTTRRGSGSSGLGLALVRAIAIADGGDVAVRSRPGETVFTLTLPRERSGAARPPGRG